MFSLDPKLVLLRTVILGKLTPTNRRIAYIEDVSATNCEYYDVDKRVAVCNHNSNKKMIFGLGTGRCGTKSLSAILCDQQGAHVTHELDNKLILPWKTNQQLLNTALNIVTSYKAHVVGDVSLFYLNYVEKILKKYPLSKFVVLKRNKQDVVQSYDNFVKCNHWSVNQKSNHIWRVAYPKYNTRVDKKKESIGLFWNEYYAKVNKLCKKYPDSIAVFDSPQVLNNEKTQMKMLDFCGFVTKKFVVHKINNPSIAFRNIINGNLKQNKRNDTMKQQSKGAHNIKTSRNDDVRGSNKDSCNSMTKATTTVNVSTVRCNVKVYTPHKKQAITKVNDLANDNSIKKVWTYWENKPNTTIIPYIKMCHESMIIHSIFGKNYKLIILNPTNVRRYVTNIHPNWYNIQSLAHKADYIRAKVVLQQGGVWLDADTIVLSDLQCVFDELNKWEFFGFYRNNEPKHLSIGSFAARKGSLLLKDWVREMEKMLDTGTRFKWMGLGSFILDGLLNKGNISRYRIKEMSALSTVLPIPYTNCHKYLEKGVSIGKYINNFQPYIMLTNEAFPYSIKCMSRNDVLNSSTVLAKFFLRAGLRVTI